MREWRSSPRYSADKEVLLRWENGMEVRAKLENISLSGASIRTESPPPECRMSHVWINDGPQFPWAQAKVIKVRKVGGWFRRGSYRIQVNFTGSCPYDFFTGVINDFAENSPPSLTPDYESYWR